MIPMKVEILFTDSGGNLRERPSEQELREAARKYLSVLLSGLACQHPECRISFCGREIQCKDQCIEYWSNRCADGH